MDPHSIVRYDEELDDLVMFVPDFKPSIEEQMRRKYNIPLSFIGDYLKFASERSTEQVVKNVYLMPKHLIDKQERDIRIQTCASDLTTFNNTWRDKKDQLNTQLEALLSELTAFRVASPGQDESAFVARRKLLIKEFAAFINWGYAKRYEFFHLSTLTPVDGAQFNSDMHTWAMEHSVYVLRQSM